MYKISFIILLLILPALSFAEKPKDMESEFERLSHLSLSELMDLKVVTATGREQDLSSAPAIITVITSSQIQKRGYRSVAEALQNVVGMDVVTDHFQSSIGIRGVHNGRRSYSRILKVMINGQSISFRPNSDNYLDESLIPMDIIDRIEVIRGPNSALYGADAYLGVVNIITKTGEVLDGGRASQDFTFINGNPGAGLSLIFGKQLGLFDLSIAASHGEYDHSGLSPVDLEGENRYEGIESSKDLKRPTSLYAKLTHTKSSIGDFSLDFHRQEVDAHGEFQDWSNFSGTNRTHLENFFVRSTWSKEMENGITLKVSSARSKGNPLEKEYLDGSRNSVEWFTRELSYNSYQNEAEFQYSPDNLSSLTFGSDYSGEHHEFQTFFRNDPDGNHTPALGALPDEELLPDLPIENRGYYAQLILYPFYYIAPARLEGLGFTAGIRKDFHNIYDEETTWRSAVNFEFLDGSYTKLMYGTSFKAPSVTQLYSSSFQISDVIANPYLRPERAKMLDWMISVALPYNFRFNFDAHWGHIEDKVEITTIDEIETARNLGEIDSWGLESEIMYNTRNIQGYASYTFEVDSVSKEAPSPQGTISLKYRTQVYPRHMIKFGSNLNSERYHINVNLEGRWIDERICQEENCRQEEGDAPVNYVLYPDNFYDQRYTMDSYMLFDLALSTYNFRPAGEKETIVMFKVYNLLDSEYGFPGNNGTNSPYDIPGMGRWYSLKIAQDF